MHALAGIALLLAPTSSLAPAATAPDAARRATHEPRANASPGLRAHDGAGRAARSRGIASTAATPQIDTRDAPAPRAAAPTDSPSRTGSRDAPAPRDPAPTDAPSRTDSRDAPAPRDAASTDTASRTDSRDAPAPRDAAPSDAVDTVVLRVQGLDPAALRAALIRRRPDLVVRDDAPADAARSAFVEVVATPPDVSLDVVLADGRAYRRTLRPGSAPGERAAARLLVQLLAAIAERRAEPERRDVPIPAWTRDAPADPGPPDASLAVPEPGADPSPARVPDPPPAAAPSPIQIPDPPLVAATDAPSTTPPRDPDPPPAPPANPSQPPVKPKPARPGRARGPLELGLAADFTSLLGLTPPRDVSRLRGLGGALHLDLRLPRGLVIGLAARGLARGAGGFQLARLRGAASLGYLYRRHRFELLASAGLSFETWRVRQAGDGVYYAEPGADIRPLLLGGLVRAAPGLRLTPGRRVALRLGAWLELAGSVLPTGAAARLSVIEHDGTAPLPRFALGGLELAMGVELAAWFTLRNPPAPRP